MGSYENIVKTEEIRRKVHEGDLVSAQEILDTVELKKVKNLSDLNLMAEVFKENGRYDEAEQLYLRIFEKSKTRKTTAQLVDIAIKKDSTEDAEKFFALYQSIAPGDYDSYIYRYKIDKLQGASYDQLIQSLETLKKLEYTEKWAYELAKLYYKAGMEAECMKECSDIILWFVEGIYVEKAKMLRSYYTNGTDKQKIMEELKRRAEAGYEKPQEASGAGALTQKDELQDEATAKEEEIYSESSFMIEHEVEELEYGLREGVQNILMDEGGPKTEFLDNSVEYDTDQLYDEVAATAETVLILQEEYEDEQYQPDQDQKEQARMVDLEYYIEEDGNIEEEDAIINDISETIGVNLVDVFGDFLQDSAVKLQLLEVLVPILQGNSVPTLLLISGASSIANINLAKDMALFMNYAGRLSTSKIAKISAQKLNALDIRSKGDTLRGCCLVIEKASELQSATLESVADLTNQLQEDFAVIFEDEDNLEQLYEECLKRNELRISRIHLS